VGSPSGGASFSLRQPSCSGRLHWCASKGEERSAGEALHSVKGYMLTGNSRGRVQPRLTSPSRSSRYSNTLRIDNSMASLAAPEGKLRVLRESLGHRLNVIKPAFLRWRSALLALVPEAETDAEISAEGLPGLRNTHSKIWYSGVKWGSRCCDTRPVSAGTERSDQAPSRRRRLRVSSVRSDKRSALKCSCSVCLVLG